MSEQQQHPALALPGFTRAVTLSTGVEVHIRKLNVDALKVDAARQVLGDAATPLTATGELDTSAFTPGQQLDLLLDVQRRMLRSALVQPRLEELTAMYGGREDDADFGLGPDMDLLLTAIDEFKPQPAEAPAVPSLPKSKARKR